MESAAKVTIEPTVNENNDNDQTEETAATTDDNKKETIDSTKQATPAAEATANETESNEEDEEDAVQEGEKTKPAQVNVNLNDNETSVTVKSVDKVDSTAAKPEAAKKVQIEEEQTVEEVIEEVTDDESEDEEEVDEDVEEKVVVKIQRTTEAVKQQTAVVKEEKAIGSETTTVLKENNENLEKSIGSLKQKEIELLEKQRELAQQIQEQQALSAKLASDNQKLKAQQQQIQQDPHQQQHQQQQQQIYSEISKSEYTTSDQNVNQEANNGPKKIDLQKIFTPATDSEEILPKPRKLYAYSAFYSPALHPTVEDQVELARRISHSLSDITNKKSKGQLMYVNRKKRSLKWVHEGDGEELGDFNDFGIKSNYGHLVDKAAAENLPLRLLMNPSGQLLDYNTARDSLNIETGQLSPSKCAEVLSGLQNQGSKGAELFAKRRRKVDEWVTKETAKANRDEPHHHNQHNQQQHHDHHHHHQQQSEHKRQQQQLELEQQQLEQQQQQQATLAIECIDVDLADYYRQQQPQRSPLPPGSPQILPAYSDAAKQRVQLNLHQAEVLEKYKRPAVTALKSPWEAALETGSTSSAFVEDNLNKQTGTPSPIPGYVQSEAIGVTKPASYYGKPQQKTDRSITGNYQRDLAYKPSLAQGWNSPIVSLPKELYVPKELPLNSYAPPPAGSIAHDAPAGPIWRPSSQTGHYPEEISQPPIIEYSQQQHQQQQQHHQQQQQHHQQQHHHYQQHHHQQQQQHQQRQFIAGAQKHEQQQYGGGVDSSNSSKQPSIAVNFNPLPLSQDKLGKFGGKRGQIVSDFNQQHHYQQQQQQQHHQQQQYHQQQQQHHHQQQHYQQQHLEYQQKQYRTNASPRNVAFNSPPLSLEQHNGTNLKQHQSTTMAHTKFMQRSSFNNSARGWCAGRDYRPRSVCGNGGLTPSSDLPYTDF